MATSPLGYNQAWLDAVNSLPGRSPSQSQPVFNSKTGQWMTVDQNGNQVPAQGMTGAPPPGYSSWDQFSGLNASNPAAPTGNGYPLSYPQVAGYPSTGFDPYSAYATDPTGGGQSSLPPSPTNPSSGIPGAPPPGTYPTTITAPTYQGSDPGPMSASDWQSAYQYGGLLEGAYANAAAQYGNVSGDYMTQADQAYSDLMANPGFSPQEKQDILQQQGLQASMTSPEGFQSNYLTGQEQSQISGDPYSTLQSFEAGPAAMENTITQQGAQNQRSAYQFGNTAVTDALHTGSQAQTDWQDQFGQALGDTISAGAAPLDESKLTLDDNYVNELKRQAGAQIGAQIGSTRDQLIRQAASSGTSSPLATASALEHMNRDQDIQSADAITNADIAARQAQLQSRQQYAGLTQSQEQIAGGLQGQYGTQRANVLAGIEGQNVSAAQQQQQLQTGMEAGIENQNLGANQYIGSTQAQIQQTAEENASQRAAFEAQNRQSTSQANQWAQWAQGYAANQALSQRNYSIAQQDQANQQEARNYLTGQTQWTGGMGLGYNQARGTAAQIATGAASNATRNAATWAIGQRSPSFGQQLVLGWLKGAQQGANNPNP